MYLQWQGHLSTGQDALDIDVRDATIATIGTGTYLYTSTGIHGGLAVYELSDAGGTAQLVDQQYFTKQDAGGVAGVVEVVEFGGQTQLVFGSAPGNGLIGYELSGNGTIGGFNTIMPASGNVGQMSAMAVANTVNGTRLYTIDSETGVLNMHTLPQGSGHTSLSANGASVQNTALTFSANTQIETIALGGKSFLLATDQQNNAVISYGISNSSGALTERGSAGTSIGLGISLPTALETVSAFGQSWVVLGSAGSSSLSVMRLEPDGRLEPVDHIIDTLSTRFAGVTTLAVAQDADRVFVIAGGSDDGVSVFTLAPDGRLLHLQTLPHTLGGGLQNVNQLTASVSGDQIQVFATSGTAAGLTQFNIDLDQMADATVAAVGAQTLRGGDGQDMLVGSDVGADTLIGGAGDDILISGAAGARMTGGDGADRFVIHADAPLTTITDFTPGVDQIDLSDFPMLRWVGQLGIQPTAWGARITFRDATINVQSKTGGPMDSTDLFGGGFIGPDRVLVLLPDVGDVIVGTIGNDVLQGTQKNDTIRGIDGHDTIVGNKGNDVIEGGAGDDLIFGSNGADTLNGSTGNDEAWGGAGNDLVIGGAGNDTLGGSHGNDTIDAGDGDDEAWASADNDLLYGGAGHDTLGGGTGGDTVWGEKGNDTLWGGQGNDEVRGGKGDDLIGGGPDKDQLWGEQGNDTFWANAGNDTIWGGQGHDLIGAGANSDLVYGDSGDDELRLGRGNDTGRGGTGADTLLGAQGNDLLIGEKGNDLLIGGSGADTLIGGKGADSFVFYANQGWDRVRDFTPGEDIIVVGSGATRFKTLSISQEKGDVLITLGSGMIRLEDVDLKALDYDDFLFL